ncbi:MAG: YceD family protein [Candidatus Limnocylindria bacterium]
MTSFNVAGLLRDAPGAVRDYRLRDRYLSLGSDVELAGPLSGSLRLQRTNRGILVRGSLEAMVRRTCARCLEAYVEPVTVQVSEEYLPSLDPDTGTPLPEPDRDEFVQVIDEHHEIDLLGVLREEFALSEPMHPLCSPDCPGLCPDCGTRLGPGHPSHAEAEIDPRLAGLARLLEPDDR